MSTATPDAAHDDRGCTLKELPEERRQEAAAHAIAQNEANRPDGRIVAAIAPADEPLVASIAMMMSKYWGTGGVRLSVGFLHNPPKDLRAKILEHMNAWGKRGDVTFRAEADALRRRRRAHCAGPATGIGLTLGPTSS